MVDKTMLQGGILSPGSRCKTASPDHVRDFTLMTTQIGEA